MLSKTYSAASVQVRGPGRFSDFALSGRKREPHASINGHEHQDSPALLAWDASISRHPLPDAAKYIDVWHRLEKLATYEHEHF